VFLKMVYHGAKAMEDLVSYDPHLVPGIMGGSSGTTFDAFNLLEEARKHGARAALFGRKINNSEHQLSFVSYLRAIADANITALEATKAYHGDLQKLGIKPYRSLNEDLQSTTQASNYAGTSRETATAQSANRAPKTAAATARGEGAPDFKSMTSAQKVAYARQRLKADISRDREFAGGPSESARTSVIPRPSGKVQRRTESAS
jgi:hypothetical protein